MLSTGLNQSGKQVSLTISINYVAIYNDHMRNHSRRCNRDWEGVGGKNPNLGRIEINKLAHSYKAHMADGWSSNRKPPAWPNVASNVSHDLRYRSEATPL